MASVRSEVLIEARPEVVWAALREWGALHERLVPGFVVDSRLDGDDRLVTFFDGAVARERLVDIDDESRRLVWSVVDSPTGITHHNASAQVLVEGEGRSRFVWIADVLPHSVAGPMRERMDRGVGVVKRTLESHASSVQ
jgi:hypothetical protein